jgi:hypothetical protein
MLPFHVARLSDGGVDMVDMRDAAVVEPERTWSGVGGFTGEGGAYIPES